MRDSVGNPLAPGRTVLWLPPKRVVAIIARVDEPSLPESAGIRPATITYVVTVPVAEVPRGSERQAEETFCIVAPDQQEVLERALGGGTGRPS